LAVDATSIYWTNPGSLTKATGAIYSAPINPPDGGTVQTTLATGQDYPLGIAVDSTSVYWVSSNDGTVRKVTPK
jgi:hypothetical protein